MQTSDAIVIIVSSIALVACSDSSLRLTNELGAGYEEETACTREAPYETAVFDGFSYRTGGLCNIWQGQISNESSYTIKCDNTINGKRLNPIYASPEQNGRLRQIGLMSGKLTYNCMKWARAPYIWNDHKSKGYQVLLKMNSGKSYLAIKSNLDDVRTCFIKNKEKEVLIRGKLEKGQLLGWILSPIEKFYTNCL